MQSRKFINVHLGGSAYYSLHRTVRDSRVVLHWANMRVFLVQYCFMLNPLYVSDYIFGFFLLLISCPRGPTDKAPDYESGDCGFESHRGCFLNNV